MFFDLNSSIVSLFRGKPFINFDVYQNLCQVAVPGQPDGVEEQMTPNLMGGLSWSKAELAVAHLSAIAFTCHQLRRGTPQAVFQIGGRDKLIDLIISIVLGELRGSFDWVERAEGACPEVIEMKRCVFQGAEAETTASFAYAMALFASKLLDKDRTSTPSVELYSRVQKAVARDRVDLLPELIILILRPPMEDPARRELNAIRGRGDAAVPI